MANHKRRRPRDRTVTVRCGKACRCRWRSYGGNSSARMPARDRRREARFEIEEQIASELHPYELALIDCDAGNCPHGCSA